MAISVNLTFSDIFLALMGLDEVLNCRKYPSSCVLFRIPLRYAEKVLQKKVIIESSLTDGERK